MSQGFPGFVQVAPDSTGKKVRNIVFAELQADGTYVQVNVQGIYVVDPITGIPTPMMNAGQADVMIALLRRIAKKLETR